MTLYEKIGRRLLVLLFGMVFLSSVTILSFYQYRDGKKIVETDTKEEAALALLTKDSEWAYLDGGVEPGVGNVWTQAYYDRSSWKTAKGSFAAAETADVSGSTRLVSETEKHKAVPSYFFRTEFFLEDVDAIASIRGKLRYRDAVLIYLNGTVIFAGNVPSNGYTGNQETGAAEKTETIQEAYFTVTDTSALREGKNVLAIELHQKNLTVQNAYLEMAEVTLSRVESKESMPLDGTLFLEQGASEDAVCVNWITEEKEFYQVEYLEDTQQERRGKEAEAWEKAKICLMGRQKNAANGTYSNTALLQRLKADTQYRYRIRKVGSKEASEEITFTTKDKKEFLFGIVDIATLKKEIPAFAVQDMNFTVLWNLEENQMGKKELFFADKLVCLQKEEDFAITYQDTLLLILKNKAASLEEHTAYIKQTMEEKKRKWVVLLTEDGLDPKWKTALGVDLIVCFNTAKPIAPKEGVIPVSEGYSYRVKITKDELQAEACQKHAPKITKIYQVSKKWRK